METIYSSFFLSFFFLFFASVRSVYDVEEMVNFRLFEILFMIYIVNSFDAMTQLPAVTN